MVIWAHNAYSAFLESWQSADWQVQVICIEATLCIVLIFLIYLAWAIYGKSFGQLLATADGTFSISSSAQNLNTAASQSKKTNWRDDGSQHV